MVPGIDFASYYDLRFRYAVKIKKRFLQIKRFLLQTKKELNNPCIKYPKSEITYPLFSSHNPLISDLGYLITIGI